MVTTSSLYNNVEKSPHNINYVYLEVGYNEQYFDGPIFFFFL